MFEEQDRAVSESVETPASPQSEQRAKVAMSSPAFGLSSLLLVLMGFLTLFGYSIHERNAARDYARQNEQTSATLKETRSQIDMLNAKLDALNAERQAPPRAIQHHAVRRAQHVTKPDPRWKKLQGEIDAQSKAIDETRQELASTRTDLQGSIAKTHDELVVLQRKGERNYYEFDLDKSKHFAHAGPVEISLRKANTKHEYADLELMVDDREMSKKHLNLYEPAMFYPDDSQQPLELVINSITKNHIHGYISAPKYRPSELTAMNTGAAVTSSPVETPSSSAAPQLRHR
jgi:hypothetical protein